ISINQGRACGEKSSHRCPQCRRRDAGDVFPKELFDLDWVLIRHEPEIEFGSGVRGDDRFDARSLVTPGDACDAEGWADPRALVKRKTALAPAERCQGIAQNLFIARTV